MEILDNVGFGTLDVIGFGLSVADLTEKHKSIIQNADVLIAGKRHLELLKHDKENKDIQRETISITKDIEGVLKIIKDRIGQGRRVVVVASGDPLFHGIGITLINAFGKNRVNIYPNISSVAAAFAAIKESWHDAELISLHGKEGKDEIEELNNILRHSHKTNFREGIKIAILTDHIKTPAWIAEHLILNGLDGSNSTMLFSETTEKENIIFVRMYVFENLGSDDQRISFYDDMTVAAKKQFINPNIVIIKSISKINPISTKQSCVSFDKMNNNDNQLQHDNQLKTDNQPPIYLGMEDELFSHEKGLITKSEIRAVVLSKLQLISDDHIFWDLGAGSGSVSIEVSRFIPKGRIFAVEKNVSRAADIKNNMTRFGICDNNRVGQGGSRGVMSVIHGELPDAVDNLPDPDRVFIGGGGRNISDIIKRVGQRLKNNGIIVINTVLIQTMNLSIDTLKKMGFHVKLTQIQISTSKEMPFGERLEALNPVWIISGKKEKLEREL